MRHPSSTSATEQLTKLLRERAIAPTCEAAGVPRTTVNRWLRGEGGITLAQAEALAVALGLRVVIEA